MLRFTIISFALLCAMTPNSIRAQHNLVGVTMDLPDGHPLRYGSTIKPSHVDPPSPIRFDVNGRGYRYPNRSSADIRGFRIRVADPIRDRFDASLCSGDRIFGRVRVIDGGKVVEFGDGIVLDKDEMWIHMPNRSQGGRRIYYLGEALTSDPIPPTPLTVNDNVEQMRAELWAGLRRVCPSKYRNFSTYGVTPSLSHLCFVSSGITFVYDHNKQTLFEVHHSGRLEDSPPNRISHQTNGDKQGTFVLWNDGVRIVELALEDLSTGVAYSKGERER